MLVKRCSQHRVVQCTQKTFQHRTHFMNMIVICAENDGPRTYIEMNINTPWTYITINMHMALTLPSPAIPISTLPPLTHFTSAAKQT